MPGAVAKLASINLRKLVLSPTGSINLGFVLREDLLLCSSYLPLGVPNWAVIYTPSHFLDIGVCVADFIDSWLSIGLKTAYGIEGGTNYNYHGYVFHNPLPNNIVPHSMCSVTSYPTFGLL
jgi:hypothetical protein